MQKWRNISINFIVDLPSSNGFTNIIVVVDCLMKMRHMIPMELINAISVAEYFIKHVFKLYGLPNLIISNCGSQFVSDFWQALYK
jgi:hypothetical protein